MLSSLFARTPLPALVGAAHSRVIYVDGGTTVWAAGGGDPGNSWLIALDLVDGHERWRAPFAGNPSLAVGLGTNSFAVIQEQQLDVRETFSGRIVWSTDLALIPQQVAFKQEWFEGTLRSSETQTTNCSDVPFLIKNDSHRLHLLLGLGGTNLLLLRDEAWRPEPVSIWTDWLLFDGGSMNQIASGEGSLVAATKSAVLFYRCGHNYRIQGGKVSRSPLTWPRQDGVQARVYRSEPQRRIRSEPPSILRVLWDDASQMSSLNLREPIRENDRWWKASTNLIRITSDRPLRAEGWSLAGKALWRIALPKPESDGEPLLEWMGEDGVAHYFCGQETVIRIVPGKLTSERIIPTSGETVSTNSLFASFALAPAKAVLLEATGEQEWRMTRAGPPEIPSTQVVRLTGRDPATGKILWSISESVTVKRAKE